MNKHRPLQYNSTYLYSFYLGQTTTSNEKCDDEILKRIEIASGAFNSMLKTITARYISMKTRKIIIKAYDCVVDTFIRI